MQLKKYLWAFIACFITTTPFIPAVVSAEGIDGTKDIICSVRDVVGCTESGQCLQGSAQSFDLPDFVILDAKKKVVRSAYESGHKAVSLVKNMELSGNHLVLQGIENSRGWDIAIDTKTGSMSGAVVGDAVSMLVFGTCTGI